MIDTLTQQTTAAGAILLNVTNRPTDFDIFMPVNNFDGPKQLEASEQPEATDKGQTRQRSASASKQSSGQAAGTKARKAGQTRHQHSPPLQPRPARRQRKTARQTKCCAEQQPQQTQQKLQPVNLAVMPQAATAANSNAKNGIATTSFI